MDSYTVGVAQLTIRTNRTEENLAAAKTLIQRAARQGARLVVLPEAFATGLNLPKSRDLAETIPGPLSEWLGDIARSEQIHVVAGILERVEDRVHSAAVVLDDTGQIVHVYRRIYIYDLERFFIAPGDECHVIETKLGRLGVILGYDIQFPEVTRVLFAQRAEILICPAVLLLPFAPAIRQMALARASENACYVIVASASGENTIAGLTFLGHSMVLQSPIGTSPFSNEFRRRKPVLAETGRDEIVLLAELDMRSVRRLQSVNPLYKDFRRSPFTGRSLGEQSPDVIAPDAQSLVGQAVAP